jgi:glycosyltransferase involved in cell wall biosynthesis
VPIASSIAFHRARGTWRLGASRFIALSHFARSRFAASGLPEQRIDVLPNFVPNPAVRRDGPGDYFMFLGRIAIEKGPDLLASAWSSEFRPLLFVGEGPMRETVQDAMADRRDSVRFLGSQPYERCMELLANARGLIVPSRWYEGSPMVIAEAYARGVPVIGPRLGAFPELVRDQVSGLLFEPDDRRSLRQCISALHDPELALRLGAGARESFDRSFTPEQHYQQLLHTYHRARGDVSARSERDHAR